MANRAYLLNTSILTSDQKLLNAKLAEPGCDYAQVAEAAYIIPIPWLCCFRQGDVQKVKVLVGDEENAEFIEVGLPCTSVKQALDNLKNSLPLFEIIVGNHKLAKAYWDNAITNLQLLPLPYITMNPTEVMFSVDHEEYDIALFSALAGDQTAIPALKDITGYEDGVLPYPPDVLISVPGPNWHSKRLANAVALDSCFVSDDPNKYFWSWATGTKKVVFPEPEHALGASAQMTNLTSIHKETLGLVKSRLASAEIYFSFMPFAAVQGEHQLKLLISTQTDAQCDTLLHDKVLRQELETTIQANLQNVCRAHGFFWLGFVFRSQESVKKDPNGDYNGWISLPVVPGFKDESSGTVMLTGVILSGHKREEVVVALAKILKTTEDNANALLSGSNAVVKRNVLAKDAERYIQALKQTGADSRFVPILPSASLQTIGELPAAPFSSADSQSEKQVPTTGKLELVPVLPVPESNTSDTLQVTLQQKSSGKFNIKDDNSETDKISIDHGNAQQVTLTIVENAIGVTKYGHPFIVRTPQSLCCNCGQNSDLSFVNTAFFKDRRFSTTFEKESGIVLALPYCEICALNVGEYPTSSALKWLIGFAAWLLTFLLSLSFIDLSKPYAHTLNLLALILPIIPIVWILRLLGRPKPPQTSTYTPVKIKEFSRNPNSAWYYGRLMLLISAIAALIGAVFRRFQPARRNQINRISMKFSNPLYSAAFQKENAAFIQQGSIRIL